MIPHSKPTIRRKDIRAVAKVMRRRQLAGGKIIAEFERLFADTFSLNHAVATSSGTAALHLALCALDIGAGDEIILPGFVCVSLLQAIQYVDATAVFAEIDPKTYNIDPDDVRRRITDRTRAIIVPHLFGLPADIEKISCCGIPIIEDCAQAIGAKYNKKPVGSFGDFAVFSFYATKMMATGEGGMITAKSASLVEKIKDMRSYDGKPNLKLRYNYKMSDIEAALGIAQLKALPQFIQQRIQIAEKYSNEFHNLAMQLPHAPRDSGSVYYRYVVRLNQKAKNIIKLLNDAGIQARKPIYIPLQRLTGHRGYRITEEIYRSTISLPIYPSLRSGEQRYIINTVRQILE